MPFQTRQVDYNNTRDADDLVRLLSEYATLETGDADPDLGGLPKLLAEFPTSFSLLAFDPSQPDDAIGLINCFYGMSTFYGRKLVNVHDVIVTEKHRGKGVAAALLQGVEEIARQQDCCRITLEVYADNPPALRAYEKYGFTRDPAKPEVDVLFMRKSLV